ncbi:MAG: hypothetical protein CVT67_01165 [Actinobacteria bacterium HGW-Actinobacteria-7]|jgi:hypothetical protein|nr:MAG: hypothetical protein CVT67_01165 [Actinobacteria bacterium HGW-Actinobacteria-7]
MDQNASRVRAEDIEECLGQVGEIKAARVVVGIDGQITEIHILALPTKSPKQLVRDIESTLMAQFGIPIDHRKISIAQLGRESIPDAPEQVRPSAARPRIVNINASVSGMKATASVTLEIAGREFIGMASGPASQTGRLRNVAGAALDAVGQYLGEDTTFALEDVAVVQLGREKVAVACISLVTHFGEQAFSGSALVRQNDSDSVVRATLDAINRRIALLTIE